MAHVPKIEELVETLKEIKIAVNRSLGFAATIKPSFKRDAINWACLRCVNVQWCVDEYGDTEWLATISEAAPDATALQEFVRGRLAEFGCLAVRTEW